MNNTKEKHTHTPGPWHYTLADETSMGGVDAGEKCICDIIPKELEVTHDCEEVEIANANARLIAQSPEMYELLVRVSQSTGLDLLSLAMEARDVLAKVDGGEG